MHNQRVPVFTMLLLAAQAQAHHGISNWDLNTDVTLSGRITGLDFFNPHAWLKLEVKTAAGKTESWSCEMRSAYSLRRSGWSTDMFKAGTAITVTGSPERTKPRQCYLSTIRFADGSSMVNTGTR